MPHTMSEEPKILTGLMERRALEAAFNELAEISDAEQLSRRERSRATGMPRWPSSSPGSIRTTRNYAVDWDRSPAALITMPP